MSTRIETIAYWHDFFNQAEFNGKLITPLFGLTRSTATDGYFEYVSDSGWKPLRQYGNSKIVISTGCFECEDSLQGTILHEMVHQYQVEVLDRNPNHDAVFLSICRKLEKKYGFGVR